MLSRTANAIYWMSRYLERVDNVARFIQVNIHLILDLRLENDDICWRSLVSASGDDELFAERYDETTRDNVLHFLTFDKRNPNSILSCIHKARENARSVREIISCEMWGCINELFHLMHEYHRKRKIEMFQAFFEKIRMASHLYMGLVENTMSHSEEWHFARVGRMLERADKTARILDVKYFLLLPSLEYIDSPYDSVEWSAVLKSVNAFETYRKQYHRINYKNVADLLIFDTVFPRSITYCVETAKKSLKVITDLLNVRVYAHTELQRIRKLLGDSNVQEVLTNGLHEFIDLFQFKLNVLDVAIQNSFFAIKKHEQLSQEVRNA